MYSNTEIPDFESVGPKYVLASKVNKHLFFSIYGLTLWPSFRWQHRICMTQERFLNPKCNETTVPKQKTIFYKAVHHSNLGPYCEIFYKLFPLKWQIEFLYITTKPHGVLSVIYEHFDLAIHVHLVHTANFEDVSPQGPWNNYEVGKFVLRKRDTCQICHILGLKNKILSPNVSPVHLIWYYQGCV